MEAESVRGPSSCCILLAFLFLMVFSSSNMKTCTCLATNTSNPNTTDFIRTSCGVTTYPQLCYTSLSSFASSIQANPRKLAQTALNISITSAQSTSVLVSKLSQRRDLKTWEAATVKDCVDQIEDSIDELKQSLEQLQKLEGPGIDFKMSNIKTWLSAALSNDETCMDGIDGKDINEEVNSTIKKSILNVAKLTSNALAIINHLT
ncbi:PREDICTED: 21 kDa protein-like [Nelumbo nucifera]|uniref:Pectinesterase inhibitor domain-containing protein n=2 Tax=Nelumbo nucifera TaxID=4432 RepID=A0A822XC76_NELNU|nr:PREDICTED: 21 kDa protein-like [Nelumbo nucifera]DAD17777.1 TPA_asm: hypothetical protein HUJ06_019240 [Nelumbo nucifera]